MRFLATVAFFAAAGLTHATHFKLKTTGAANNAHNNLYVYTYHTGAGFNDAVLDSKESGAPWVHLNETRVSFELGDHTPWNMDVGGDTNYASWELVTVNAGEGSDGFSINENGLVLPKKSGFGGWLVCEWYHNGPQLFWINGDYSYTIPCSCSKVKLEPIYPA
ncbi:hypothetical protein N7474_004335 [Penicillium riverlandense]|uniref:uncharacterized protein n=1 Tax=Penicillium riverlandense TaxID=1903569 RepID=UPI0025485CDC|nr:uncharacterized protein N7474_004335 [Penicillium riverlandense]KAJ5818744.1 hypothetical protein N7474_004335 [Penicillium riverlandense]